jgi:hypothetical protein
MGEMNLKLKEEVMCCCSAERERAKGFKASYV